MQRAALFFSLALCLFLATLFLPVQAQPLNTSQPLGAGPFVSVPGPNGAPVINTRLLSNLSLVRPGDTLTVAWQFKLQPHWHVYWQNPGDSGLPATLKLAGSKLPLRYPAPKVINVPPIVNYGYEDTVTLYTTLPLSGQTKPGLTLLPLAGKFLYCHEVCMPGTVSLTLPILVGAQQAPNKVFPPEPPAPATLQGLTAQQHSTGFTLALPRNTVAHTVRFFPADEGTIDDAAPQPLSNHTLSLSKDTQAPSLPTALKGLLVIDGTPYQIDVPISTGGLHTEAAPPASGPNGLATALFFAFIAGLLLNLMPCVLPVLSLKVLSLMQHHRSTNRRAHLAAYSVGVIGSFTVFAGAVAFLRMGGATFGWGFHLQNPLFVAVLTMLMTTLAFIFFGIATFGETLSRLGLKPTTHESLLSSALTGALAVVVATPCTVPFMGGAMAYALTQPLVPSLLVFIALGSGMAAPFLLAIPVPQVLNWLPKPGPWMPTLRHALGWPMLGTALWLLYVFANQTDTQTTFTLLTGLLALAFALWLKTVWPSVWSRFCVGLAVGLTLLAVAPLSISKPNTTWQSWSPEAVASAQAQNVPVFIDFTADWCVTCKVNELTTLSTQAAQSLFAKHHTILLKADWTKADPAITQELERHGRKGVPLYLLYKPGQPSPTVLPQILSPASLKAAFTS